MESKGKFGSQHLCLSIGGVNKVIVPFTMQQEDLNKLRNYIQSACQKGGATDAVNATTSEADEIMKYKSLLDAGAITQDEYDIKKKQLLGL